MASFSMRARGPFQLAAAARFTMDFPAGPGGSQEARLDLAFPASSPIGVRVTGDLEAEIVANPGAVPVPRIRSMVERILSLDVDGTDFPAVAERDSVVRGLQARFPGLRPVLFYSPYEAAAWAIIGQRIRMTQAATIKNRLATELGEVIDFGDRTLPSFPPPERLADLGEFPGLTDRKISQLRSLSEATALGRLDADLLRSQDPSSALAELQTLPGIGPFSAELILLRGAGHPDVFPTHEPRLHRAMAEAYRIGPSPAALQKIADNWRPFRTWTSLLLRAGAAGPVTATSKAPGSAEG